MSKRKAESQVAAGSDDSSESGTDDERESPRGSEGGAGAARQIFCVLDLANLETVKTKKGDFELMNCDDHVALIKKNNKDPAHCRPDIIHQELMAVMDSPLNKAGKMRVLIHSEKNVLISVNAKTRIPRTFKRFSGLMVQLLHKLKIRSADGKDTLLKVVKNPISRHLPAGARCYGFSQHGKLYAPQAFAASLPDDVPIVFVIGAMATGSIRLEDHPYVTELVSVSEYPLSGVVAINRILGAIEANWGIV